MSKVDVSDGCWNWMRYRNPSGHGRIRLSKGGKLLLAHRVAYEMIVGEIPTGSVVRHSCDNPSCVKPTHLELGSQADNMKDMAVRDRGSMKLDSEAVRHIRNVYVPGRCGNNKELREHYGVSRYTIHEIATGRSRKYVR